MGAINKKSLMIDVLMLIAGSILYAASVNIFTEPNQIAPGGITGISTLLKYLFSLPIGITSVLLNIPLFIWGAVVLGKKFLIKTIIATISVSISIDAFAPFMPEYVGDKLLAGIFGGITMGAGLALIFIRGATTGGVDIIARIVNEKKPALSVGRVILLADLVVVMLAWAVYRNMESPLYAIVCIFITSKVLDTALYGSSLGTGKMMFIISMQNEEIAKSILNDLERGVTKIKSVGGYSGIETEILLCAVRRHEVYKTYDIVRSIDPNAFIIVGEAAEITGEGFARLKGG